jgi:hypothetical protein
MLRYFALFRIKTKFPTLEDIGAFAVFKPPSGD